MTEAAAAATESFDAAEWAARGYPTKAIWALVLACVGIFVPIVGVVGLGLGVSALRRINREGRRGRGIALTAVVLGGIELVLLVLGVLLLTSLLLNA